MTERPILFSGPMVRALLEGRKTQTRRVMKPQPKGMARLDTGGSWPLASGSEFMRCPYGVPGDRLWVRESWRKADSMTESVFYRADEEWNAGAGWKPSIHMPRWASRLTLEVTGVKVERVQEISERDAVAEGMPPSVPDQATAVEIFEELWDSINEARGYGWSVNPWVWALTFRVLP